MDNPYAATPASMMKQAQLPGGPSPYTPQQIRSMFTWFMAMFCTALPLFLVGFIIILVFVVAKGLPLEQSTGMAPDSELLIPMLVSVGCVLLGELAAIAAIVFSCIFLYRCWSVVQGEGAPTTPGKAVGFLFIPFFNLYWVFVAYHGLSKRINALTATDTNRKSKTADGLFLTLAILCVVSAVPYIGLLALLPMIPVVIVAKLQLRNAIVAIAEERNSQS